MSAVKFNLYGGEHSGEYGLFAQYHCYVTPEECGALGRFLARQNLTLATATAIDPYNLFRFVQQQTSPEESLARLVDPKDIPVYFGLWMLAEEMNVSPVNVDERAGADVPSLPAEQVDSLPSAEQYAAAKQLVSYTLVALDGGDSPDGCSL